MERRAFIRNFTAATTAMGTAWPSHAAANRPTDSMSIDPRKIGDRNQNRSTVVCQNGMVCTSQPLASNAGLDILKAGGNAIEAAICANAVLSVVEPMNCGPGGDLFAIVWSASDRKLLGLNASGRSPYAWNLDRAAERGISEIPAYSPLAWSVPGCISGWESLLARFGKKSLPEILAAAIAYAREGFPVSPIIASDWGFDSEKFPTLAEIYQPEGKAPEFGEISKNPHIADFFEGLSKAGLRSFYEGDPADRIVRFSEGQGGLFSKKDFVDHEATWVDPVSTAYRGYDVWEIPPNGQGIAVLQILNILENFDIPTLQPNSPDHLHLFIEAKKLAYEDRAFYYADRDFVKVPLEELISKEYAKKRAALIDLRKASTDVGPGLGGNESDTVYLTAADREGNMISLIQSTYHGWGSHLVPDRMGFALQNRGKSFSLDPERANKLEPHKRPFHTIIPAFVTREGLPVLSFGVMGGDFQPQGHCQVLMNLLDFGMSPQQAGEQPRVEHGGSSDPSGPKAGGGGTVHLEHGFSEEFRTALADLGHHVRDGQGAFGGYQAIWRMEDPLRFFGGTDPRKDGCAVGW